MIIIFFRGHDLMWIWKGLFVAATLSVKQKTKNSYIWSTLYTIPAHAYRLTTGASCFPTQWHPWPTVPFVQRKKRARDMILFSCFGYHRGRQFLLDLFCPIRPMPSYLFCHPLTAITAYLLQIIICICINMGLLAQYLFNLHAEIILSCWMQTGCPWRQTESNMRPTVYSLTKDFPRINPTTFVYLFESGWCEEPVSNWPWTGLPSEMPGCTGMTIWGAMALQTMACSAAGQPLDLLDSRMMIWRTTSSRSAGSASSRRRLSTSCLLRVMIQLGRWSVPFFVTACTKVCSSFCMPLLCSLLYLKTCVFT